MRKNFTKRLAVLLALVLCVCGMRTTPVAAAESEFTATLGYANSDWSAQEWGENANTVVTGEGTYTLSWDGAGTDALVFVVDLAGAQAALSEEGKTFNLTDLTVAVDGNEIAVDLAKVATGDLEENGNWRIEIYNEYGTTKENAPIDPAAVSFASNLTVTFTVEYAEFVATEGEGEIEAVVEEVTTAAFDANGTYNAYLMLQTPNWTYRDAWNSANGLGSDYFGNFIFGNETSEKYGVVTDAVVAGNGTYTVSVVDFGSIFSDDFATAGQDYFNILGISTDIPLTDDVQITDVKLIIDGQTRHTYSNAYLDPDETEYVKVLVQNIWNEDVKEISYYPTPSSSVEIQFTISGFAYDAEVTADTEAVATTEATVDAGSDVATESGSSTGIIVAVVLIAAAAVVVVLVLKKKKAN